jgi:hypothetical protein
VPERGALGALGALEAAFRHLLLSRPEPYPTSVAHWIAEAIMAPHASS